MSIVYLNGEYLPKEDAKISPDDRGFLLADGVYEVTPFYEGVPFGFDGHIERLRGGLAWMQIDYDVDQLDAIHRRLIAENDLGSEVTSLVYLQITRGAAPRTTLLTGLMWTTPPTWRSRRPRRASPATHGASRPTCSPM